MSNRFLEEYLIYFNFWLMQWENVQYVAISENYWYRTKSEKPGLWVKMTWGQNQIVLSLIHLLMTKSSLILASDTSWRNLIIDNISNFQKKTHTPPQMWATVKLLQNVTFWTFWRNFKNWARSAMIDVSKSFILMMGSYSPIYIKMNFQCFFFRWKIFHYDRFSKRPKLPQKFTKMPFETSFVLRKH